MPDWTERLTAGELLALKVYEHQPHTAGDVSVESLLHTISTLRALVEELKREGEYLMQDIGPCMDEPGASCSQHPWAGVARCSARDFGSVLALTEASMREKMEGK